MGEGQTLRSTHHRPDSDTFESGSGHGLGIDSAAVTPLPGRQSEPHVRRAPGDRAGATSLRTRRRGWIVRRALLLADTIGIGIAVLIVALAGEYTSWLLLSWPLFVTLGKLSGIYGGDEKRAHHGIVDDTAGVFQCLTASSFLILVISLLTDRPVDTEALVTFWSLTLAFVVPARIAAYAVIRRTPTYVQRTIIVGAGDVGQLIARKILQHPEYGINLVGFVDANPKDAARRPSET